MMKDRTELALVIASFLGLGVVLYSNPIKRQAASIVTLKDIDQMSEEAYKKEQEERIEQQKKDRERVAASAPDDKTQLEYFRKGRHKELINSYSEQLLHIDPTELAKPNRKVEDLTLRRILACCLAEPESYRSFESGLSEYKRFSRSDFLGESSSKAVGLAIDYVASRVILERIDDNLDHARHLYSVFCNVQSRERSERIKSMPKDELRSALIPVGTKSFARLSKPGALSDPKSDLYVENEFYRKLVELGFSKQ